MDTKDLIEQAMKSYADTCGDLDLRAMFGSQGSRIQIRNETQDTGQAWFSPSYIRGMIQSAASVIDSSQAVMKESLFVITTTTGFILPALPKANVNYLSGYQFSIFRDGLLMRYVAPGAPVTSALQYRFSPDLLTVSFTTGGGTFVVQYAV